MTMKARLMFAALGLAMCATLAEAKVTLDVLKVTETGYFWSVNYEVGGTWTGRMFVDCAYKQGRQLKYAGYHVFNAKRPHPLVRGFALPKSAVNFQIRAWGRLVPRKHCRDVDCRKHGSCRKRGFHLAGQLASTRIRRLK